MTQAVGQGGTIGADPLEENDVRATMSVLNSTIQSMAKFPGRKIGVFRSLDECQTDADCGRGNTCHPNDHYCRLSAPVKVGAVLSLSGNLKLLAQGQTCKIAFDFVRDYVAAQEVRPLDRGIDFVYADDQSDPATAGVRARELLDAGALMVLGALTSAQTLEMLP